VSAASRSAGTGTLEADYTFDSAGRVTALTNPANWLQYQTGTPTTLFMLDVETGMGTAVKESYCKVDAYYKPGWVSRDVVQQNNDLKTAPGR